MQSSELPLVVIRGSGDLGSGVAYRLFVSGFPVIMTDLPTPLFVRRTVSFGNAIYTETMTVEGITSRFINTSSALWLALQTEEIPIVLDAERDWLALRPAVIVDARLAKRNIDTQIEDAPLVIALGPGFVAGSDCHAIIETNRGHSLGRVIWRGSAEANTGTPGKVMGMDVERVLRAPCDGYVIPQTEIGNQVEQGQPIATIEGTAIVAPFTGRLRGLIHESVRVWQGLKIGDLDPRGVREHCFTISDKALAMGGGVLEAILSRGILPLKRAERPLGTFDAAL